MKSAVVDRLEMFKRVADSYAHEYAQSNPKLSDALHKLSDTYTEIINLYFHYLTMKQLYVNENAVNVDYMTRENEREITPYYSARYNMLHPLSKSRSHHVSDESPDEDEGQHFDNSGILLVEASREQALSYDYRSETKRLREMLMHNISDILNSFSEVRRSKMNRLKHIGYEYAMKVLRNIYLNSKQIVDEFGRFKELNMKNYDETQKNKNNFVVESIEAPKQVYTPMRQMQDKSEIPLELSIMNPQSMQEYYSSQQWHFTDEKPDSRVVYTNENGDRMMDYIDARAYRPLSSRYGNALFAFAADEMMASGEVAKPLYSYDETKNTVVVHDLARYLGNYAVMIRDLSKLASQMAQKVKKSVDIPYDVNQEIDQESNAYAIDDNDILFFNFKLSDPNNPLLIVHRDGYGGYSFEHVELGELDLKSLVTYIQFFRFVFYELRDLGME